MEHGRIESLWRYPVKSLIGERLTNIDVDARGLWGDRLFALSNADGKIGSGKDTQRFKRIDGLFSLSAKASAHGVSVTFSDGRLLTDKDPAINKMLSQTLGQSVTLTKEGKIPHFDNEPIHIVTTASLSLLREFSSGLDIDSRRFRPNLVMKTNCLDQDLIGKRLKIGQTILEITQKTKRCRMITLAQPGIDNKPKLLNVVSKRFGLDFGVYAKVISTGTISVGEHVEIVSITT